MVRSKAKPIPDVYVLSYMVTSVIDGITHYFDSKTNELEKQIKDKAFQNLQFLSSFREDVQALKKSLCNNVRNSNMFLFDFLTFFLIDIYFMRRAEISSIQIKRLASKKTSKKLVLKSISNSSLNRSENQSLLSTETQTYKKSDQDKLVDQFLAYDNLSQSIYEVKQRLKEFQNVACNLESDIIGETSYIRARSQGAFISLNEDTEGNFFQFAKIAFQFGDLLTNTLISEEKNLEKFPKLKPHETAMDAINKEYQNRLLKLPQIESSIILPPSLSAPKPPIKEILMDPYKFFKENWNNLAEFFKTLPAISKLKLKLDKPQLEALQKIFNVLPKLIQTIFDIIYLYKLIRVINPKDFFVTGIPEIQQNKEVKEFTTSSWEDKIYEGLPGLIVVFFDYILTLHLNRYSDDATLTVRTKADAEIWFAKQKLIISFTKIIFFFVMHCLSPYILEGLVKLTRFIVKIIPQGDAAKVLKLAGQYTMNIIFGIKIFLSLLKLIVSVIKYLKTKKLADLAFSDFYSEKLLRENMTNQLKIQIIFVIFRYNTVILQSFDDILDFHLGFDKIESSEQISNVSNNVQINAESQNYVEIDKKFKTLLKSKDEHGIKPARYNDLPLFEFFIKICQENETYCFNFLTKSTLKNDYGLPEDLAETILQICYNDVVSGPITDIFVAISGAVPLSEPYIVHGNFRFFRKEKADEMKDDQFGSEYAILYRRSGNSLNYLEDINYDAIALPMELPKLFEQREKIIEDLQKKPDSQYILNTSFTSNPVKKNANFQRNLVHFTIFKANDIETLRETDQKNHRKLIFSLDKPDLKLDYNFKTLAWDFAKDSQGKDFSSKYYFSSYVEGEDIPQGFVKTESAFLEYYSNPCYKIKEKQAVKKVHLVKMEKKNVSVFQFKLDITT